MSFKHRIRILGTALSNSDFKKSHRKNVKLEFRGAIKKCASILRPKNVGGVERGKPSLSCGAAQTVAYTMFGTLQRMPFLNFPILYSWYKNIRKKGKKRKIHNRFLCISLSILVYIDNIKRTNDSKFIRNCRRTCGDDILHLSCLFLTLV
ncbi:MAG: hypothetical protein LBV68_04840 [Spirochaetaceae bacterium]|jgi:hypothetical protein|nr:hypothetical protein [Spirochaetaceae bacterium]